MATRRKPDDAPAEDDTKPDDDDDKGGGDDDRASLIDELIARLKAEGLVASAPADVAGDGDASGGRPRTQAQQESLAEDTVRRALSRIGAERDLQDVKEQVAKLSEKAPVQQSWLNKLMWGKAE